jgi:hypothetical protein
LREWVITAPLPPHFQEGVWQRIARAESAGGVMPLAERLRRFVGAFAAPRVAYAYVAGLVALGIAAGSWTAQVQRSRVEADLGHRYVQSIDPNQMVAANR